MSEWFEELSGRVDALLNRAACELVLGGPGSAGAAREALIEIGTAIDAVAGRDLGEVPRLVRDALGAEPDRLAGKLASIDATWNAVKARVAVSPHDTGATVVVPVAPEPPTAQEAAGEDELAMLQDDPELAGMFIAEALDHLSSIEALVLQVEAQPGDARLLNDVFRPFHTIKGNAGALGVTSVQALAHGIENLLDLARSGRLVVGADEVDAILHAVDLLTTMIQGLSARLGGQPAPDVRQECLALQRTVEALVRAGQNHDAAPDVPPMAPASAVRVPARPSEDSRQAVKVDTRKLDNLVDMVGELVIVQSIIREHPSLGGLDEQLTRHLAQLKRITGDLQRNAMSMRMTPIRQTFQKMSRLVRDLSKKSGKTIDLVLSGEDTELDRKVVEDINDPLMHMVRNSVDHGIESPDDRRRAGKAPTARVALNAYHEGGNIVIAIADDGAGLNTGKIRAKAMAQGLIPAESSLSAGEIHDLIFRPGFSTADKVTEISGRGVGMDVVRRNIEALRGRIEIQSAPGAGTTFAIKLPLTLAIVEGLLLRIGAERFVLPTFAVRESLRPVPAQVHALQGRRQLIQVRDSLLPLVCLGELFGVTDASPEPCESTVVVIEDNGRRVGLIVDELLGKQEVVIKALGSAFSGVRGVAGGAILGDGRVGLILDAGGLVSLMDRPLERAA
jgi:two-component system, chemotaxis family, sensor kinase CheA